MTRETDDFRNPLWVQRRGTLRPENRSVIKRNPALQAGMSEKLEHRRNVTRRLVGTREERDSRLSIQFCQQTDPFAGDFRIV